MGTSLKTMNIHHLELFYYVAKHGGIMEAVRKIPYGIQQPAVSGQIAQLEEYLGVTLFQRRPFALTPEGEKLYEFIAPFFTNLKKIASELQGGQARYMHPRKLINQLPHDTLVAAIHEAELKTSGQIRVLISHKSVADPVAAAQKEFDRLGMAKSPEQNGVLIFVAPRTQKFAVIGDARVHAKCGDIFWQELAKAMTGYFRKSEFTEGIIHGVRKAGELLAAHFPKNQKL